MTQVTTLREFLDQAKPVIVGWITERDSLSGGIGSGGGGGGGLSSHALDGIYHTGTLADSQAPQFLKTDGTRALTGNLAVDTGVTIDGVDISDFYTDYGNHITNSNIHVDHTTVSIIAGDGLTGGGTIAASRTLNVVGGAGITANADSVDLNTPGTLSYSSSNSASGAHTHAITTSSNPGAAAQILASTADGYLTVERLGVNWIPTYPLQVHSTDATQVSFEYDTTHYARFAVNVDGDLTLSVTADMTLDNGGEMYLTPSGDIYLSPGDGDVQITGQLGIGVLPSYALQVRETVQPQIAVEYDAANYAWLQVTSTGDIYYKATGNQVSYRDTADTDGYFYFRANNSTYMLLEANWDNSAASSSGIIIKDYTTSYWGLWKQANHNFIWWDYTGGGSLLEVTPNGSLWWTPYGNYNIRIPGNEIHFEYDVSNYASFSVSATGQLTIDATGDLIRVGASNDLETANFASHSLGWQVTYAGYADFRHIWADELQVQAFTADIYQAVIGSIIITPGRGQLSRNFTIPATSGSATIYFYDLDEEGWLGYALFTANDYVRLRYIDTSGGGLTVADVWGQVTSYADQTGGEQSWTFTVTDDGGVSGEVVFAGSIALGYGASGDGTWLATVTDTAGSPYSQVATWTTNPWTSGNWTVHARIGNLDGIGTLGAEYGIWAGQGTTNNDKQIIMSDSSAAIRNMDLYVTWSGINRVIAHSSGYISAGNVAPTAFASGNGFWAGVDGTTSKMFVGNKASKYMEYNGTDLYIYADSNNYIRTSGSALQFYVGTTKVIDLNPSNTGDLIIGNIADANIWWDANGGSGGGGRFNFRDATSTPQLYIDDDGALYAGAGEVKIGNDGIFIIADTVAVASNNAVNFVRDFTGNGASELGAVCSASENYLNLAVHPLSSHDGFLNLTSQAIGDNTYAKVDLNTVHFTAGTTGIEIYSTRTTSNYRSVRVRGAGLYLGNTNLETTNVPQGELWLGGGNGTYPRIYYDGGAARVQTSSGYVTVGPQNTSWAHFYTDRAQYYFDEGAFIQGGVSIGSSALAPTDYQFRMYSGTTLVGQISYSDTSWMRLGQDISPANIYTPRSFAVAGAFSVGTSSFNSAGDLRVTTDINAGGGLYVGNQTTDPAPGNIHFTGLLYKTSTRASTVFPLTSFTTLISGASRTSANNGTITAGGVGGIANNCTGVFVTGVAQCNNTAGSIYMGTPGASINQIEIQFHQTGSWHFFAGYIPCNSGGDIYAQYNGTYTYSLYLRVSAYTI